MNIELFDCKKIKQSKNLTDDVNCLFLITIYLKLMQNKYLKSNQTRLISKNNLFKFKY